MKDKISILLLLMCVITRAWYVQKFARSIYREKRSNESWTYLRRSLLSSGEPIVHTDSRTNQHRHDDHRVIRGYQASHVLTFSRYRLKSNLTCRLILGRGSIVDSVCILARRVVVVSVVCLIIARFGTFNTRARTLRNDSNDTLPPFVCGSYQDFSSSSLSIHAEFRWTLMDVIEEPLLASLDFNFDTRDVTVASFRLLNFSLVTLVRTLTRLCLTRKCNFPENYGVCEKILFSVFRLLSSLGITRFTLYVSPSSR